MIGRIFFTLVPSDESPTICISLDEDADIYQLFEAFEAFVAARQYHPDSWARGLECALDAAVPPAGSC